MSNNALMYLGGRVQERAAMFPFFNSVLVPFLAADSTARKWYKLMRPAVDITADKQDGIEAKARIYIRAFAV